MHRIYLFQENQAPVDNPMQLQIGREVNARTFWDRFDLVRLLCFYLNAHLICSAEFCCTWLFFYFVVFVDVFKKFFAET